MARVRKKNAVEAPPPFVNENIHYIDLYYNGEYVKPGTLMKIKNDRNVYIYESMQCNSSTGKEWVNFRSQTNGDWKSVYPSKIAGLHLKRSLKKK